jgi:integrase
MPINRTKDAQGRPCFEYEFSRRIGGQRFRIRERLPSAWTRTQADAFDRKRSAEIYAQATGIEARRWLIDEAVACYLSERAVGLKSGVGIGAEIRALEAFWKGQALLALPGVCAAITKAHRTSHAPATIKNKLSYLISACRYFWKARQLGGQDPGAGIAKPAVSNERHVYIDRAEMLLLCKTYCPVPEVRAAIRIAFYSGMRRGEILAATIGRDSFVLEDTKNGERRVVPVHPKVRCCAGYEWPTKYKLGYWFRKARYAIAREDLHFHDLRHSAASEMINAGIDLYTVGGVLGHKSHASTGRYAHLATDALRRAIGEIGRPDSSPLGERSSVQRPRHSPMEARAGVEPTYSDLQSRKRA